MTATHDARRRPPRRGIYLLPSLFTLGNMFCGYACVVYAMRGEFDIAAQLIGIAFVLDMLDGRIARMTGTATEFGVQFDSMADIISFGMAPAMLSFAWGLQSLGRLGWAAAFLFVTGAALRLARFNIQAATQDKRFFVGMPSPPAACVIAATVFAFPEGFHDPRYAIPALAMVLIPGLLMVSTIRYHSFKTVDLRARRSFRVLLLFATLITLIVTHPQLVLMVMAYTYLCSPILALFLGRMRRQPHVEPEAGTEQEEQKLEGPASI
jgi:CDP-diacylglycerol---serine O-phosphatidyltransferase